MTFFFDNNSLCKCDVLFSNCQHGKNTLLVWVQNNQAGYKLTGYEITMGMKQLATIFLIIKSQSEAAWTTTHMTSHPV